MFRGHEHPGDCSGPGYRSLHGQQQKGSLSKERSLRFKAMESAIEGAMITRLVNLDLDLLIWTLHVAATVVSRLSGIHHKDSMDRPESSFPNGAKLTTGGRLEQVGA